MKPKKYLNPELEPDALPQIPPEGAVWRVWVAKRDMRQSGFFDVEAATAEEAMQKILEGAYGLGWVPLHAERLR